MPISDEQYAILRDAAEVIRHGGRRDYPQPIRDGLAEDIDRLASDLAADECGGCENDEHCGACECCDGPSTMVGEAVTTIHPDFLKIPTDIDR